MAKKTEFRRIRIFLSLFVSLLFVTCQQDDDSSSPVQENQAVSELKTMTSKVSAKEIPNIMNYLSTKGDSRGQFTIIKSNDDTTRSNESDLVIGELQTKEIVKVTDQYDRSNYTFLLTSIEGNDSTTKSIFNLIVKESREVGLFSYIIEYRPDTQ